MKRRQFLAFLGFFSFGGTTAFWRLLKPSWRVEAAEEHLTRSVAALADVMFPGDGVPRASKLGIHRRVLEMAELQTSIANGVAWLDQRAARQGAADFLGLDEAFVSRDDGIQLFVLALRFHLGRPIMRRRRSSRPSPIPGRRSRRGFSISRSRPREGRQLV